MRSEGYSRRSVGLSVCMSEHAILAVRAVRSITKDAIVLNEQLAHKRGVAGPKKMAPGSNYCQHGCLVKARNLVETDTNS